MARKAIIALGMAATLAALAGAHVVATPSATSATPSVAATGASVAVSGTGCASDVRVTATAFLFPSAPFVSADTTLAPAPSGQWHTTIAMPAAPAYVTATCDGVASAPLVIAPTDVDVGSLAPSSVTDTEVVITTSPLVNETLFNVYSSDGLLLGSSPVVGGVGTVSIPRSIGPTTVLATGLRQQDPAIPLPFVPIARRVQIPPSTSTTIDVLPRVTVAGGSVTATGSCPGSAHVTVTGRANGWYDIPPVFVDAFPPVGPGGAWVATFPMPPEPSTAVVRCSASGFNSQAARRISPSAGDLPVATPDQEGDHVIVGLPSSARADTLEAFRATGEPVPLSVETTGGGVIARMTVTDRPTRVVLIGVVTFGENAEALQVESVQAWTVDVTGDPAPSASFSNEPSPSVEPSASPSQTASVARNAGGITPPPTDTGPTSRPAVPGFVAALLLLLTTISVVLLATLPRCHRTR